MSQAIIDEIIKKFIQEDINYKHCNLCNRVLPEHNLFFSNHSKMKNGLVNTCKECESKRKSNGTYKFENLLRIYWYHGKEDEFINKFRYMLPVELADYFKVSETEVNTLCARLKLRKKDIINDLADNEVIYMYNSLLEGRRKSFTNGFFKNNKYVKYVIRFLIDDILNWSKEDICNRYNLKVLDNYKLSGLYVCCKLDAFEIINLAFPEYNLKRWELKNSSVGNGFWNNRKNIEDLSCYIIEKNKTELNISNIIEAGAYGFSNLSDRYGLGGLCLSKYENKAVKMFEDLYGETFDKKNMLKINYTFKDNPDMYFTKKMEGIIYVLTDRYNLLDSLGKTLINEIIRYCEEKREFPVEKHMSNKNGYISRTQFYKYFNSKSFTIIYNYIIPVETRPDNMTCIKCDVNYPFTDAYFSKGKNNKFGLKYECKDCTNKKSTICNYKKKGIVFNRLEDISPEIWTDYLIENRIKYLPNFCLEEENLIRIFRHWIFAHLKLFSKEEICDDNGINIKILKNSGLYEQYKKFGSKLNFYQKVLREYSITEADVSRCGYTEESIVQIWDEWINQNNLSVVDLLKSGLTYLFSKKIDAMLARTTGNKNESLLWYFKTKGIKHPSTNEEITVHDFEEKPNGYWENKDNCILQIKKHCESRDIGSALHSNVLLKKWVYDNFRQGEVLYYGNSYKTSYDALVDAYPEIIEKNLLFEWEWHQYSKSDEQSMIKMLRELVNYRLNEIIIDVEIDLPKTINYTFMNYFYPKFNKQIINRRFADYHEWCSKAFPEFANKWTKEDFGILVARDGSKCSSIQEKFIYEFIKYELNFKYITAIGIKRSGKHVFKLSDDDEDERYCPDFVIDRIKKNNEIIMLGKPIYIEYYGWYVENHQNPVFIEYKEKTKRKNKFYRSREEITFIDLYPKDLTNGCKNIINKLNEVPMQ